MKKQLLFIALFISGLGISQSVNDYKAVIIPLKFEFMKSDNQYRLATLSKLNLNKAGFEAYYINEDKPYTADDRCNLLDLDVLNIKAFLSTKLYVVLKDCYGKEVYKSDLGLSREKDYETAFNEALNKAFESVIALNYQYSGKVVSNSVAAAVVTKEISSDSQKSNPITEVVQENISSSKMLYAQPTASGFQLVDSTPSVIYKIQKTAKTDYFLAQKGEINGVMFTKDNQWFFEYYQGETLISEKVDIKF